MDQARRDLAMAGQARDTGFLEWGCFILEQAAEKAIVAVYQRLGAVRVGSFSISSKVSGQPAGRSLPTSFQSHAVSTACISRHATQTGFPGGSRPTTSSGRMQTMQSVVRKESFGSVTVFWLDTDLVHERRWRGWQSDPNVLRVILFGSFAEGRAVPGSDLDVMIVLAHD
jgi:hypothetical protein